MTRSEYLNRIKSGAIETWNKYQILPSLTGAQAALESGWGTSTLSKPPYNNNFGIKASGDWTGRTVKMPTREWNGSQYITVQADFRAYDNINDSVRDHGAFFTSTEWRRNNYSKVIGERDYIKGARALQSSGYATDPRYANKLIEIIEQYGLNKWDEEALNGVVSTPSTQTNSTPVVNQQPTSKRVGGELTEAGRAYGHQASVSVIGDSLGVGTKPYLQQLIPNSNYDVVGSRQITHSTPSLNGTLALQNMKSSGQLKDVVVVILGTNRGLDPSEIDSFMEICGRERKVLWVETFSDVGHRYRVRSEILNAINRHRNAYMLSWSTFASPRFTEFYGSDRIHMTPSGYQKHAEHILQAVYELSTGNMDTRIASTTRTQFSGLKGYRLYEDGKVEFEAMDPAYGGKKTISVQTNLRGLTTDGITNYIYNVNSNERWNPQKGNQTADWIDGYFEDSELSGVELLKAAGNEMMKRGEPETLYRVKLSQMPSDIQIGSEGMFIDHNSNPPLYLKARVLEITTSDTNPEYDEVVIGNVVELEPYEKTLVHQIQNELSKIRDEMLEEWQRGEPLRVEIKTLGTLVFSTKDDEVQLLTKVYQGNADVTEQFDNFVWTRTSSDTKADENYNTILYDTERSSTLVVKHQDVVSPSSTFICRVYDNAGSLVGSAGSIVTLSGEGKSAFQLWKEHTKQPNATMDDFIEAMKGEKGSPGIPGEDGKANYIHIAWATSPLGDNFNQKPFNGANYMGTAVTDKSQPPDNWQDYSWVFVKGEKGEKGDDGSDSRNLIIRYNEQKSGDNSIQTVDVASDTDYAFSRTGSGTVKFEWLDNAQKVISSRTTTGRSLVMKSPDKAARVRITYPTNNEVMFIRGSRPMNYAKSPEDIEYELSQKSNQIDLNNILETVKDTTEKLQSLNTELNLTKDNAIITHSAEYIQSIETLRGDADDKDRQIRMLEQHKKIVDTHFTFDDSLTIGKSDSKNKVRIDNERMEFLDGETVTAYLSGNFFNAQNMRVTTSFEIGNHKFEVNGENTSVRWIGGANG